MGTIGLYRNFDGSLDSRYPNGGKPDVLAVPTSINATGGTGDISITWVDAANTTSTFVYYGTVSGSLSYHGFANAGVQSYNISGLAADTYYVALMSHNSTEDTYSALSAESTATVGAGASAPAAPSGLTATASGSSVINLAWTDNSNNETGFVIERSPDGSTGWTVITTTGANVTTYANSGLSASTAYYYRVKATNGAGDSSYSGTANDTTGAATGQKTVTGSGFGTAPNVVVYQNFSGTSVGNSVSTGNITNPTASDKTAPVIETFAGRKAWEVMDGTGADQQYKLRYASLTRFARFLMFKKKGYASGADAPGGVTPYGSWTGAPSSWKDVWFVDNDDFGSGLNANADIVVDTHTGGGNMSVTGNSLEGSSSATNNTYMRRWGEWINLVHLFDDTGDSTGAFYSVAWSGRDQQAESLVANVDVFTRKAGAPTLNNRGFTGIDMPWQGSDGGATGQSLKQGAFYLAEGANCHKCVILANNATLANATDIDVVAHDTWSDTQIQFTPPPDASNFTHYFVCDLSRSVSILASGALA